MCQTQTLAAPEAAVTAAPEAAATAAPEAAATAAPEAAATAVTGMRSAVSTLVCGRATRVA
jgi:hypothetical protein